MRKKKKISVSLTHELLKSIKDNKGIMSRSAFIERGMRDYLLDAKGVRVLVSKEE